MSDHVFARRKRPAGPRLYKEKEADLSRSRPEAKLKFQGVVTNCALENPQVASKEAANDDIIPTIK